jgi:hypothetical protein
MSDAEQKNRIPSNAEGKSSGKKPYQKPEMKYERVFETMALSCGKVQTTQGQCHANRKAS